MGTTLVQGVSSPDAETNAAHLCVSVCCCFIHGPLLVYVFCVCISPCATLPDHKSINCALQSQQWAQTSNPAQPCLRSVTACTHPQQFLLYGGQFWTEPQIVLIITADHTRIAAHMQAIKYLTLDFHPLSFCLVWTQHGINLARTETLVC